VKRERLETQGPHVYSTEEIYLSVREEPGERGKGGENSRREIRIIKSRRKEGGDLTEKTSSGTGHKPRSDVCKGGRKELGRKRGLQPSSTFRHSKEVLRRQPTPPNVREKIRGGNQQGKDDESSI